MLRNANRKSLGLVRMGHLYPNPTLVTQGLLFLDQIRGGIHPYSSELVESHPYLFPCQIQFHIKLD